MTFATFTIDSLDIHPDHITACTKAGLYNAADILLLAPSELNKRLKYPRQEQISDLIKSVSSAILPSPLGFDHLQKEYNISKEMVEGDWVRTGDAGLDTALGGGLRVGTITELAGESASGKSHFCLHFAITAQIASLSTHPGSVMILTSEREIATDRMIEIGNHLLQSHSPDVPMTGKTLLKNVLSNIVSDVMALDHTLTYKIPHMLRERLGHGPSPVKGELPTDGSYKDGKGLPVRLLIIDSITALIRGADSNYNSTSIGLTERSKYLCSVSDRLKAIALEFGLAVLIINQVTDVFDKSAYQSSSTPQAPTPSPISSQCYTEGHDPPMIYSTQSRWFSGQSDSLKKEASLGIVWANAVNTRIMLSRTGRRRMIDSKNLSKRFRRGQGVDAGEYGSKLDETVPTLVRRLHIVFSPFAPTSTIDYIISASGIHSLPDSYRLMDIAETMKRKRKLKRAILGGHDSRSPTQRGVMEDDGDKDDSTSLDIGHSDGRNDQVELERDKNRVVIDDDNDDDDIYDEFGDLPLEWWQGNEEALYKEPLALGED